MKRIFVLLAAIALFLALAVAALGLGDDVEYSSSSNDSSSSYSSYDDDDDNYSSSYSSGYSSYDDYYSNGYSTQTIPISWIFVIVVIVIYVMIRRHASQSKSASSRQAPKPINVPRISEQSLAELRASDPAFDGNAVESMVKRWVTEFENAWCDGDMSRCKENIGEDLYSTYQTQLEMMRKNFEAARSEDLAVLEIAIESWQKSGSTEYLDVWMKVKKRTYKVDLNRPDQIVKGDWNTVYYIDYRWQLSRGAGTKKWVLHKVTKIAQVP